MPRTHPARVLVLIDSAAPPAALLAALEGRREQGPVDVRLVLLAPGDAGPTGPAGPAGPAEVALLHAQPRIEAALGARVRGSVSARHDVLDVIEEALLVDLVEEVLLVGPAASLGPLLHDELPRRLQRHGPADGVVEPVGVGHAS